MAQASQFLHKYLYHKYLYMVIFVLFPIGGTLVLTWLLFGIEGGSGALLPWQKVALFVFFAAAVFFYVWFLFYRVSWGLRQGFEYESILKRFIAELSALSTIERIGNKILVFLGQFIGFDYGEVVTFDPAAGTFTTLSRVGELNVDADYVNELDSPVNLKENKLHINIYSPFLIWLEDTDQILTRMGLDRNEIVSTYRHEIENFFVSMNIRIVVPLTLNSSLVGIILLGNDPSRSQKRLWQRLARRHIFRKEIELLEKLRFHASVAISHSLLYDRIVKLNESLEEKVKERTRELEETTAQLVQSEKMASMGMLVAGVAHEINTPSGVVQGSVDNISSAIDRLLRLFPDMARNTVSIRDYLTLVQLIRSLVKEPNQKNLYGKKKFQAIFAMQKRIEDYWSEKEISCVEDSRDLASYAVEYNLESSLPAFLDLGHKYGFKRLIGILEGFGNLGISLANIQNAIGNIVRIVKALKTYSHIDSSQVSEVPVEEGIDNTLVIMQNHIKQIGQLQLNYKSGSPIICYFDELNQVWTNLINNAIQAIEERIAQGDLASEQSLLAIKTARVDSVEEMAAEYDYEAPLEQSPYNGPWVKVEITDNGHGIPDKIYEQIFRPFFTTKQHGQGTGLGLGIVINILQKHNGRLFLGSQPGQTRMGIALPQDWLRSNVKS